MNWKNIKIFLLVLLAAVNVFLCAMVIKQSGTQIYSNETLSDISGLLSQSGITADKKILTKVTENIPVYSSQIGQDYAEQVASILLGEYEDMFFTPKGFSLFGKNNELLEIGNGFEIKLDTGISDISEMKEKELSTNEKNKLEKQLKSVFVPKISNSKYGINIINTGKNENFIHAEIIQTVDGIEICNHKIKCILQGDNIVSISGRWSFLAINDSYSAHLLDSVNILFIEKSEIDGTEIKIVGEDGDITIKAPEITQKTVSNMKQCYISHRSDDQTTLYLIPSWHIDWAENSISDSFYNAIDGKKIDFANQYVN